MGSMSITHWIILGLIVLVLFGGSGKISGMMGDLAKGLKTFKKSMAEDDTPDEKPVSLPPKDVSLTQDVSMGSRPRASSAEEAPVSSKPKE